MAGLGVRVYTDEDVHTGLAEELRKLGYDALSCFEAGNHNQRLSDDYQLDYATDRGLAIVVHNVRHYRRLDAAWKSRGLAHRGIIAIKQRPLPDLVRRVARHLDTVSPAEQVDRLLRVAP